MWVLFFNLSLKQTFCTIARSGRKANLSHAAPGRFLFYAPLLLRVYIRILMTRIAIGMLLREDG